MEQSVHLLRRLLQTYAKARRCSRGRRAEDVQSQEDAQGGPSAMIYLPQAPDNGVANQLYQWVSSYASS